MRLPASTQSPQVTRVQCAETCGPGRVHLVCSRLSLRTHERTFTCLGARPSWCVQVACARRPIPCSGCLGCARAPACGRPGIRAGLQASPGADPRPTPSRWATGHSDWPPAPSQPSPLPPPSHPRARGPRCPPRFRRGRAALRSAPIGCTRLCVAAAAAPAPLNVERGREGSLSMGHLSPRQPPPHRRPRPALRLPPRRLPQPRRRPRPRPEAAPQRARAQLPPPPREEPGWSWSTSAISCFQCLALCETEVSLFPFGVRFGVWIAAGNGAGAGTAGTGGSGHTRGDAGRVVASPLFLLGGPPSVRAAALVGAFVVKLGFGEFGSLPPQPHFLFFAADAVPPSHNPFP